MFISRVVPRILAWPLTAKLSDLLREPDVEVRHLTGFDDSVLHDVNRPVDLAGT